MSAPYFKLEGTAPDPLASRRTKGRAARCRRQRLSCWASLAEPKTSNNPGRQSGFGPGWARLGCTALRLAWLGLAVSPG